jgi:rhodanese-related sulfurtransferase
MQVAAFLTQQGFERVANIAGGIHAWSSQVDATVPCY